MKLQERKHSGLRCHIIAISHPAVFLCKEVKAKFKFKFKANSITDSAVCRDLIVTVFAIQLKGLDKQEKEEKRPVNCSTLHLKGIMRIPFACLLLLSATVLCQDAFVSERYRKFIKQHINGQMSANRCDGVIQRNGITKTDSNECKETNTFIRATTNIVRAICGQAGEPYGDMTRSLQPFDIVVCTLRNNGARHPHCQYRGQARTRRIAIRCEQGFPVHYDRDIVVFDN
ncbi:ribonuclease-like 3 isoform X2 [Plectropomus leopardus]|uniref:ribonuclease-like 3 isoform X2 n=1 Tax=Plectropomus leopardus TaxID=160734 RepID=UPI001C4C9A0D|nr:ribonuclease-like 3 isoform X2 [Plectropomus leopardus]